MRYMSDNGTAPATQKNLQELETRLLSEMKHHFLDIRDHFDVTVETIPHDLLGANHDEIEVIKDRIVRLENHTGLVTR